MRRESTGINRKKIITVAARLFWKKGYLGTSVDEIAAAAKLNKTTIYNYFKTKPEILYAISCLSADGFAQKVLPFVESGLPPEKKLEGMITASIIWETSNIGLAGIGRRERNNLPTKLRREYIDRRDKIEAEFRKVINEVVVGRESGCDPKMLTLLTMSLVNSLIYWYHPNKGKFTPEQLASMVVRFVLGSVDSCENDGRGKSKKRSSARP